MGILDTAERIHQGLDYHLQRHNLLTSNLAHIDTPGYRPLDLARGPSFAAELDSAMAVTDPGHLTGPGGTSERFEVVQDNTAPAGFDGNAVSVDREAVKIAANQLRYDTLAVLASQELDGLGWAANDGRAG
jgi:flagellar basal-body rod protein FlgB